MNIAKVKIEQKALLLKGILILCSSATTLPALAESPNSIEFNSQYNHNIASDLIAQAVTRVTGVEVIQTESGLELVLETVAGSNRL